MFLTLSKLKHKIQTGYGISSIRYNADQHSIPLQGIGQGNGQGPTGWGVISSTLFDT